CATFLLLIRITFEPQLIETFVLSSIVDLLWCSTGAGFGAHWQLELYWKKPKAVDLLGSNNEEKENSFNSDADYHKEFIHYYCCIGGCRSTGTEAEAWRFFWEKLEDVALLELNLKHGAFFLMAEIYLNMETVVEGIGGCWSTGAESRTRNSFRINASYDSETRYYCCCFGGCCSTGIDSEALRLFWKKLEDSMGAVVEGIGGCCFTGAVSKACKLFFVRNSFRINASYDSDTRINANYDRESSIAVLEAVIQLGLNLGNGDFSGGNLSFFLIGNESGAWRLFWRKLADVALLQLNLEYGSSFVKDSFNDNTNYDKESRHYYCCFGGCYSTGTESESLKLLWRELEDVAILKLSLKHGSSSVKSMEAVVERIGGCYSTEAESKMCKLFSFGRNLFRTNASYDNQSSHYYRCFGGCYSTGTESGEWRLFWRELEYAIILWLISALFFCFGGLFSISWFIITSWNLRLDFYLKCLEIKDLL
uniref:Uncharacterized protein n=1 Tax=Strongyloides stercoralis TaxID=6248 RepID=A0AAF5DCG6_STRER